MSSLNHPMHGGLIFFTGAPLSKALQWDDQHLTVPSLKAFQDKRRDTRQDSANPNDQPAWRILPLKAKHLTSGLTQASDYTERPLSNEHEDNETSFPTANDIESLPNDSFQTNDLESLSSDDNSEDVASQFYDQSFTIYEEIPASQVIEADSMVVSDPKPPPEILEQEASLRVKPKPSSRHLSTLQDVPNASYLRTLEPQTMTIDLVVGILQISQPRWIKTRKYNRWVELVEMTVADETQAGFGVTIWLPPLSSPKAKKAGENNNIRSRVTSLRPRDVVLTKNVALTSFGAKVHGQSMRSANTSVDLLYRDMVDSHDEPGAYSFRELSLIDANDPQLIRVCRVREWIGFFVGRGQMGKHQEPQYPGKNSQNQTLTELPLDTQ